MDEQQQCYVEDYPEEKNVIVRLLLRAGLLTVQQVGYARRVATK